MKNIYTKLCLSAIGCLMMASCDFMWFRKVLLPWMISTGHNIRLKEWYCLADANIPNYFHPQQFPDFTGGNEIITSKEEQRAGFISAVWFMGRIPNNDLLLIMEQYSKSYPQGAVKKAVWESIRNCYNVLNNLDRVSDITPENLSWWKGEALFLIGYYHQIMLEYYGPIVIIDKEIPMGKVLRPR